MNISDIQHTYDHLWDQAVTAIQTNSVRIDPHLLHKDADLRRGLSVICRPPSSVRDAVTKFLLEAGQIEPGQYMYKPAELHTTVLTIVTASSAFGLSETDQASYVEVIAEAVAAAPSFHISYRGITASPDCVMIQGYPQDSMLEQLRHKIRDCVKAFGVGNTLDERYMTHTAHMTCLRFQRPVTGNAGPFVQFLKNNKHVDFGLNEVAALELVVNDWYMSEDKVEVLHRYSLGGTTAK